MSNKAPVLLLIGYLLLLFSWAISNPPAAAPDEVSHYLRAMAVSRGDLKMDAKPKPSEVLSYPRWTVKFTRMIKLGPPFSPFALMCNASVPSTTWGCGPPPPGPGPARWPTYQGTYPPFAYVIPGIFMKFGTDTVSALLLARVASALWVGTLLGLAVGALWDKRKGWACLSGLPLAITPMALFIGSSLNPNGIEIAGSICFIASVLRLGRSDQEPGRLTWAAFAIGGASAALSRQLGMFWVVFGLLVAVALNGPRIYLRRFKEAGRGARWAPVALGLALAAAVFWQLISPPSASVPVEKALAGLAASLPSMPNLLMHQVGVFGPLDTLLPPFAYEIWGLLILLLGGYALALGTGRQRVVLLVVAAASALAPLYLETLFHLSINTGAQGRYVLPLTVATPLLSGEVLYRSRRAIAPAVACWLTVLTTAVAAGIQLLSWYDNGKRRVLGLHGLILFAGPVRFWQGVVSGPPLGWQTWAIVTFAGCLCLGVFGLLCLIHWYRQRDDEPSVA